jgi:hypothetical protein
MSPEDKLLRFFMARRAQTSTRDTTGAAMAEVATQDAIAEYGSAEAALAAVTSQQR